MEIQINVKNKVTYNTLLKRRKEVIYIEFMWGLYLNPNSIIAKIQIIAKFPVSIEKLICLDPILTKRKTQLKANH